MCYFCVMHKFVPILFLSRTTLCLKYWGESAKHIGTETSELDVCSSKLMVSAGEFLAGQHQQQQQGPSASSRDTGCGCGEVRMFDVATSMP